MNLGDLFGDYVPPQQEKQLGSRPPPYEDIPEAPEDIPEAFADPPPEYNEDEEIDYTIDDEDMKRLILDDLNLANYEDVGLVLGQDIMTPSKKKAYLKKVILKNAKAQKKRIGGLKAGATNKEKQGKITNAEKNMKHKMYDDRNAVLTDYIKHFENMLQTMKGSGIKGRRRKQRGGNVMFFNGPKQLLKKLELTIGEVIAGNTSIQMRNMEVNILDTFLRMSTINKPQYNKLYNQYFKV